MNNLLIRKLNDSHPEVSGLSAMLDKENVPFHPVSCVNWRKYPYRPEVKFRIAHNGSAIFLHWQVEESDIKAVCHEDNGKVWEDSCVEFFVSFNDDFYYNIECNCIGKILMATGAGRQNRQALPTDQVSRIARSSSLGTIPIENQSGQWELSLIIPLDVFFPDQLSTFNGLKARGNFYKCGDHLKVPHFLSWNPIIAEKPDFHLPWFFGGIGFED